MDVEQCLYFMLQIIRLVIKYCLNLKYKIKKELIMDFIKSINQKTVINIKIRDCMDYLNAIEMFRVLNNEKLPCSYINIRTADKIGVLDHTIINKLKNYNYYLGKAYSIDHYCTEFIPNNSIVLVDNEKSDGYIFKIYLSTDFK